MTAVVEIEAPALGLHTDLSNEDYHADKTSLSSSGARKLLPPSCPAKFRYEQDNPQPPSKTFDYGNAAHKMVLGNGPELVVIEHDTWNTKDAKAEVAEVRARGAIPLKQHEMDMVNAMAAAIRQHPLAAALLDPAYGAPEQSGFWIDGPTGIRRRVRFDWLPSIQSGRLIIPDYKGLAIDTAIPTPTGWTTVRELAVGDQVFDADGKPCTVTGKSDVHMRHCYRMRFDDGSSVVCDDEHLWVTTAGRNSPGSKYTTAVRTTEQIRQTLKLYGQNQHRVQVAGALQLPDVELPIHPYVLGCWLGDGTTNGGRITKPDQELFDRIADCGYKIGDPPPSTIKCPTRTIYGLRKQLRAAGLLGRKTIPSAYLRAGFGQRLELLRGLMDTDGSWNSTRHQVVFTSTDKSLAEAVCELACSLGQRAIVHTVTQSGFGLTVEAYRVTFTPTNGINPFALSRKADKVHVPTDKFSKRRVIVAVEAVPTVPTQCIAVDSPSRTYLCTESMIPTHNTTADASNEAMRKDIDKYGYNQQADWYEDGARALGLGGTDAELLLVAQEKKPPFAVNVIGIEFDSRVIAGAKNRRAIEIFAECTESGYWPGYADREPNYLALPGYAENRDKEIYL
ncbi:PD-(D/E)XK nuclease-like domain-containing protein [Streptomyces anthocyanicus]|uniref:PD-(D/E)XK nuclease-like domain-containing protein n=1 Tax=Streptomyces anthocyanicus TaxID=68174 RepID=UPI00382A7BF7